MKQLEINNELDLEYLLKKLTESAVKKAKNTIYEDKYQDSFAKNLGQDMKNLLGEQDEEEEEAIAAEEEEAAAAEEEDAAAAEEEDAAAAEEEEATGEEDAGEEGEEETKNPAAEKTKEYGDYTPDFKASYADIRDAINILRAGRSLKDEEISDELNSYYEILDENERAVLLLFLRELSKIITGAIDGQEGQDPSDPKTYFDIRKRKEDMPKGDDEKSSPAEQEKGEEEMAAPETEKRVDPTGEDTSPPIRVNESQDFSNLKKIRG